MADISPTSAAEPEGMQRRNVVLGGGLQLALRFVNAALGVGVAALLARGLGIRRYGDLTLALAIAGIGQNLVDFGIAQVAVRDLSQRRDDQRQIAGALFALKTIAGVIAAAICAVAALTIMQSRESQLSGVFIVAGLAFSGWLSQSAVLQAALRNVTIGLVLLLQGALWLAAVGLLTARGAALPAYALAFFGINVAVALLTALLARTVVSPSFEDWRPRALQLLRQAAPIGIAGIFVTIYYRVDTVLLYRLAGPRDAALYGAAYRFVDVLQIVPGTLTSILLPVVMRDRSTDRARARKSADLAAVLVFAFAAPVAVGSYWVGPELMRVIFGGEFAEAGRLLPLVLTAFASISLGYVYTTLVIAEGQARAMLPVTILAAAVAVSLNLLLIPRFGATAPAAITLIVEWLVTAAYVFRIARAGVFTLPLLRLTKCVAAALAMGGVLAVLPTDDLLLSLIAASSFYGICLFALRVVGTTDLLMLARKGADV